MTTLRIASRALRKKIYCKLNLYHYEFTIIENIINEKNADSSAVFKNYCKFVYGRNGEKVLACLSPIERWRIFQALYRCTDGGIKNHKSMILQLCNFDDMHMIIPTVTEEQKEVFDCLVISIEFTEDVLCSLMLRTMLVNLNSVSHTVIFNQYQNIVRKIVEDKVILDKKIGSNEPLNKIESDQFADFEDEIFIIEKSSYYLCSLFSKYKEENPELSVRCEELHNMVRNHMHDSPHVKVN